VLLNRDEILTRDIIERAQDGHFRMASYDVSIGELIGSSGESADSLVISPQQMIMVVSEERVSLPKDIAGYAMPKTGLSNEGILALSTGIIDPCYKGRVASILINFGKTPQRLSKGASFLRLTFHQINEPNKIDVPPPQSDEEYIEERRRIASRLPNTFLDVNQITTDVAEQVGIRQRTVFADLFNRTTIALAAAALFLTLFTLVAVPIVDGVFTHTSKEAAVDEVRAEEVQPLEERVARLEGQLETLEGQRATGSGQARTESN
jgi:deoxycytidine triphosphate deaminase